MVEVKDRKIFRLDVVRGAPCGASWDVAEEMIGLSSEEAVSRIGLYVQYFCSADPSDWDPMSGKSPVHIAGELHARALKKAIK